MNEDTEIKLKNLKNNLKTIAEELQKAHKLASLLNKFCKANINNDELYEVSYAANELDNMLPKLGFSFYLAMQDDKCYKNMDEILQEIKNTIECKNVEIIAD